MGKMCCFDFVISKGCSALDLAKHIYSEISVSYSQLIGPKVKVVKQVCQGIKCEALDQS